MFYKSYSMTNGFSMFTSLSCFSSMNYMVFPRTIPSPSKTHIGERAYVCNQCGRGFSKHFSLKLHRAFRLEKNHYESRCGKAFSAYSVLRQPQKPCTGEEPCEWMQMNFIHSVHLHRHQRTHTGGGGELHKYNKCGEDVSQRAHLYSLERTHPD